jgi:hypothetical protein
MLSSEEKHETSSVPVQQPLNQQQVLQHLQLLQERMGTMQGWAKGLSDQAQQDKLKIQTLEKQLEAAKTLQWAKQPMKEGESSSTSKSSSPSTKLSTPRLEQIRKTREEQETALRIQFTHSAEHHQEFDDGNQAELTQNLQALQQEIEGLQAEKKEAQDECIQLARKCKELTRSIQEETLQHAKESSDNQATNTKLQEESKVFEQLIEDSYEERESLQKALTTSAQNMQSLDSKVKSMAAAAKTLEERDQSLSAQLAESQKKEQELLEQLQSFKVQQTLEELSDVEEHELIEESYEERESLQQALTTSAQNMRSLDSEVKSMAAAAKTLKDRDQSLSAQLAKSQKKEQELLERLHKSQVQQTLEALADVEEHEQHIQNLEELVEDLEEKVAGKQGTSLERESEWGTEVAFLKGEVERLHQEIQEEQKKRIEEINEDEKIVMAIEAKFLEGENHKRLQSELLEIQETNILCLQSALADLQGEDVSGVVGESEPQEGATINRRSMLEELNKSQDSIRNLNNIIGNLQEDAEDGEEEVEALLDKEELYKEEIAQLQAEVQELNQQVGSMPNIQGDLAPQQDEQGEVIISALKEHVELLMEELALEQERRRVAEASLVTEERPLTEQGEVIISALKEHVELLTEELTLEQEQRHLAEAHLATEVVPNGISNHEETIRYDAYQASLLAPTPSDLDILPEKPICCPGCYDDLENEGEELAEENDWMTEISLLRSELSRLKLALESKQPQNESFPGALNTNGSHVSYIFQDERSEDEQPKTCPGCDFDEENDLEKKSQEALLALRQELSELTAALQESRHHEPDPSTTIICPVCQSEYNKNTLSHGSSALHSGKSADDSSVESVESDFKDEILLLRQEVHRQHQERKLKLGSAHSPDKSATSLVSSLESSFSS